MTEEHMQCMNHFEAHLHERLEGRPVKGLALERGHITRHGDLIGLLL
jgi:hypothetical protein